jgi:hypothetical protein
VNSEQITQSAIRNPQSAIPVWVGLAVSGVALAAYLLTLSPTVNFLDSGELITVGATAGVAHPPGYPLYTLLTILFAAPPLGDTAVRVNLISALAGALAVGLFYALVYETLRHHVHAPADPRPAARTARPVAGPRPPRPPQRAPRPKGGAVATPQPPTPDASPLVPIAAAAGAALLLAASLTFWNWATQAKMYTLHFAFVAGLCWLVLRVRRAWRGAGRPGALWPPGAWPAPARWLAALAFVAGLTFTNHLMSIWLGWLVILLLWPGHPGAGTLPTAARGDALPWQWLLRYAPLLLVCGLAPLLLYLYLPLRAAQDPLLNWGSPDTWGDFWRHITVWQFRVYIGQEGSALNFLDEAAGFAVRQLGAGLGLIAGLAAIAGAVRLARANLPLLLATGLIALSTLIYTLNYQIREVVVYYVPMYMMILFWMGLGLDWAIRAAAAWLDARAAEGGEARPLDSARLFAVFPVLLAVLALAWNAGRAGHRNDYLADAYVRNHFKSFAPNAVVLTDNWDLAAPSYYLQYVRNERPDVVIIDKNLVRYPFYLDYMDRQYGAVLAPVRSIMTEYRALNRRWVDGAALTPQELQQLSALYIGLLRGIAEQSLAAGRPIYLQWVTPDADSQQIGRDFNAHPEGMAVRLDREPYTGPPPDPDFDLRGISYDVVPKDEVAHQVIDFYVPALERLAGFAAQHNHAREAALFSAQADLLRQALGLPAPETPPPGLFPSNP